VIRQKAKENDSAGAWFDLSSADVKAFKQWRKII